jgi:hypothetical protein
MTAFRVATAADDALVRSILRENAIPGWVDMAIEREPSFFAGADIVGRDWAVVAEEGEEVVGMYTASVLPVHIDGAPQRVGYLGGLRVRPRFRHRIRHLREGYASIRRLARAESTMPWWFTAIAAQNKVARRLLESRLDGLPGYFPLGDYVTLGLSSVRQRSRGLWRPACEADIARLLQLHGARASRFQLSPVLDEATLRRVGLDSFLVHERGRDLAGVAALWDQRAFKQIVARSYRAPLGLLLPLYNAYARVARRAPLPRAGQALEQTFIAFLALADDAARASRELIEDLLSRCRTPVASLGVHASNPLVPALQSLKPLRYEACLYAVAFDRRPVLRPLAAQPEAALL